MRKTILTAALALLLTSCSNEPETIFSQTSSLSSMSAPQQKDNDTPIDYKLNIPYEFPIQSGKETVYLKIVLKCKRYTGSTQFDWFGVGQAENGMMYTVKSEWKLVVDPETNKPRNKQVISVAPIMPGTIYPC